MNTFTKVAGYLGVAILIGALDFARRYCEFSSDLTPVKEVAFDYPPVKIDPQQGCVTKADYDRITIGMTPEEVKQILGPQLPSQIGNTGRQIILHYKVDGERMNIFFDGNDEVCHRWGFNDPGPEYPKSFKNR